MAARLFTATIICGLMFTTVTSGTGCGGNLTAPSGGPVTSPNYPGNYGNDENCEWSITVLEGSIIRLTFESFHTGKDSDFLTIYDGASDNATVLQRLSGYHPQIIPIISTSNTMYLRFTSNFLGSSHGFHFFYTTTLQADPTNKDRFYTDLRSLVRNTPAGDKVIALGDFNTRSKLEGLDCPTDSCPETLWAQLKNAVLKFSEEVLGFSGRKSKD
ncbi:PREDICTED: dorsal-ventral patterning tolloid-like protein 1 [Branchiostoma belcheri]|uniref:Dorsal-ventral patterning tolloid-like protein 1 n=1 Tax=Branchiostoma belcheri TaxID=7741 RepID=A0A6P4XVS2_BRABE|nr:PREDICTED: dorsal-ventral patterning tolloid-like protein 1 [Branchiostoma belcheri]